MRVSFPPQTTIGYYEVYAGPAIEDVYGGTMAGTYVGSFVILSPILSGHVTDTNGSPVSFVTIHAGSGLLPEVTDSHGAYSLEVPPGWSGTLTPSKGTALFIPDSRNYVNVGSDMTNENFVLVSQPALTLSSQVSGGNINLCCTGVKGVTYQMLCSTNLVDWMPCGPQTVGTNGPITTSLPLGNEPAKFFRFRTSY